MTVHRSQYLRGAFLALAGLFAGLVARLVLWPLGFLASVGAFGMAWAIVWLYRKGASVVDTRARYIIYWYIAIGLLMTFILMFALDNAENVRYELAQFKGQGLFPILASADFWSYAFEKTSAQNIAWYLIDVLLSVGFSIWGARRALRAALPTQTR